MYNTYTIYVFKIINMHPQTNSVTFRFQGNAAGGSGYNETMTTIWFQAYHNEADGNTSLNYQASEDQAQGTAFQSLCEDLGNDNDQCFSGELWLYNPSSTTFVKHFMARTQEVLYETTSQEVYVAGYCNVTAAIDGVQFSMSSGNIDAGTFKMYGVT